MAEIQDSSGKKRTPNFTEAEKMLFVELVSEYKDVLENKQTNSETISLKNKCWEKVTEKFNASGYSHRTSKAIRNSWENIKKHTKKHFAEQKKELYKTGGGQSQFADNIMFNKTRDIIQPSVDGLTNIYDSDSFATIQSEQPCETFASADILNTEGDVEYLEEYEDYFKNKENETGSSNVTQSNSTTDIEINNEEDLMLVETPECSTKEKKRKITETKNMDKKRSRFISAKQKVSKESSQKKIEEFTKARSKTALSVKLLTHEEERHAIEMSIAKQRLAKEKIELEIKKTELEMKKADLERKQIYFSARKEMNIREYKRKYLYNTRKT